MSGYYNDLCLSSLPDWCVLRGELLIGYLRMCKLMLDPSFALFLRGGSGGDNPDLWTISFDCSLPLHSQRLLDCFSLDYSIQLSSTILLCKLQLCLKKRCFAIFEFVYTIYFLFVIP